MATDGHRSWGYARAPRQLARVPAWVGGEGSAPAEEGARADGPLAAAPLRGATSLAYGRGRSYGDSCLNSHGELIDTRALDHFIAFDRERGLLTAEPGVTLAAILRLIVPAGWFLPVSPGTSHATLGGAIANDVHGKNHHADGSFGRFVESFSLLRSSGERLHCSPGENSALFRATIGGLGLTGLLTRASIRLLPIRSDKMDVRIDRFHGLEAFRELAASRRDSHRYTVAWLDCAAGGRNFARGVFLAANHAEREGTRVPAPAGTRLSVPFPLPSRVLNRHTIRAFNALYFARHRALHGCEIEQHYQGFFYPLDAIDRWNRNLRGEGLSPVTSSSCRPVPRRRWRRSSARSCGRGSAPFSPCSRSSATIPSPGLLSFPRPGLCLALDFADRGARTEALIGELDREVMAAGGAAYPAKDRLMSAEAFRAYFPAIEAFAEHVDPRFSSDFWRRVHG